MIRLRRIRALGGGAAPIAFSTARIDAIACTVVHTPQIRCVKAHASRGSRPCKIISIPRNIVDDDQASRDDAAVDFGLDSEMPLDAGDGIDDDASHHWTPFGSVFGGIGSTLSPDRLAI